ncbi:MAG: DUF1826 domain-containing protein [Bradymonadia bacterium]
MLQVHTFWAGRPRPRRRKAERAGPPLCQRSCRLISPGSRPLCQCREAHVDHGPLRLITTYVGPGTQWVPEPCVRRNAFARRSGRTSDTNRPSVPDRAARRPGSRHLSPSNWPCRSRTGSARRSSTRARRLHSPIESE